MNNNSRIQKFGSGQRVRLIRPQLSVCAISGGHTATRSYEAGQELDVCDTMRDIVLVADGSVIFWVNQRDLEGAS